MGKAADKLVRQQYLFPRRSVMKLRQLSKQQNVSATEIVRRAIDAYQPSSSGAATAEEEAAARKLLRDIHGRMRRTIDCIEAETAEMQARMKALNDGSLGEKARRETKTWLRRHPDVLSALGGLFGSRQESASVPREAGD